VIFVHQNLIANWLTYLVHVKSTDELISFGFSDRSVWSLVSAKRSANRWDHTIKTTSRFRSSLVSVRIQTERKSQRKTYPKSEMTHCNWLLVTRCRNVKYSSDSEQNNQDIWWAGLLRLCTLLLCQGGVMQSLWFVCLSVSRLTHKCIYGCRPNMVGV